MTAKQQLENLQKRHTEFEEELAKTQRDLRMSEEQRAEGLRAAALGTGTYSAKQNSTDSHTIDMLRSQIAHLEEQTAIVAAEIPKAKRAAAEQEFSEVVAKVAEIAAEEDAAYREFVEKWNDACAAWDKHAKLCDKHATTIEHEGRKPYAEWHDKSKLTPAEAENLYPAMGAEKLARVRNERAQEYGNLPIASAVTSADPAARLLVPPKHAKLIMERVGGFDSNGNAKFVRLEQPPER